jgi:hypothetical protein
VTPLIVRLILAHLGIYVVLVGWTTLRLHRHAAELFKDDRQQMGYWESRLPVLVFWLFLWELTLPFTPWFFQGLLQHDRANDRAVGMAAGVYIVALVTVCVLVHVYAPQNRDGVYLEGSRVPTPYELYCQQMKALDRTQPPHQQFYGRGCP